MGTLFESNGTNIMREDSIHKPGQNHQMNSANVGHRRSDPLIGTILADRYLVLECLGKGGMGVVYKAKHELMDRIVAIKMVLPQFVLDEKSVTRFQREAQAASKLSHPNIISIHDFGLTSDSGLPYLVMDYLDGKSLAAIIKQEHQLNAERIVHIFIQ